MVGDRGHIYTETLKELMIAITSRRFDTTHNERPEIKQLLLLGANIKRPIKIQFSFVSVLFTLDVHMAEGRLRASTKSHSIEKNDNVLVVIFS